MNRIKVEQDTSSYHLENGEIVCDHNDTEVIKACCSQVGSSGYIECGCGGADETVCRNPDCTGFSDDDLPEFSNDCWG